jgi:Fe-S-cluster containining protein
MLYALCSFTVFLHSSFLPTFVFMNFNLKELEKQFHADGYRLGMQAVEAGCTEEALQKAVHQLHRMVDEVIEAFYGLAEQNNQVPACSKGCHWCCHQPVYAMSYELDYLNQYLKENFSTVKLNEIAVRSAEKKKKLSVLKGDDLLYSKVPCPLLEDGACMAYEARPVACRIYLSSNVASCLWFYNEPEKEESIPALLQFPLRMGRMLNQGFKAALKAHGIIAGEYRIDEKINPFD